MDPDDLSRMEAALRQTYEETLLRIEGLKDTTAPIAPDNAIGRLSRMDAMVNKSVDEYALRNADARLGGLEYWMDRIGTPEFGLCIKCGKPIGVPRFVYMPHSLKCLACAQPKSART